MTPDRTVLLFQPFFPHLSVRVLIAVQTFAPTIFYWTAVSLGQGLEFFCYRFRTPNYALREDHSLARGALWRCPPL